MTKIFRALAAAALATTVLTGCVGPDAICSDGEYPVKAVGGTTGAACVADAEEPPAGYVRYPEGKIPQHVDDEWDVYWSTRIVDEKGNVVQELGS